MITRKNPNVTIDCAEDCAEEVGHFFPTVYFNRFRDLIAKQEGRHIRSLRVLHAHGRSFDNGEFSFRDFIQRGSFYHRDKIMDVKDWARCHDGAYDALAVISCNTNGVSLPPLDKSILVIPRGLISLHEALYSDNPESFHIIPPRVGRSLYTIIGDYLFEYSCLESIEQRI